jgi:hypothetical protein
MHERKMVSYV